MPFMAIDFETIYTTEVSIRAMTTFNYCMHPVAKPYLVAVHNADFHWVGDPSAFNWDTLRGHTLIMHNAMFDAMVLKRLHRDGIVPAWVLDLPIVDTADMSAYLRHPRALGDLIPVLFPDVKLNKAVRAKAKGKTTDDMKGEGWWDDMVKYGGEDAEYTFKAWEMLQDRWPESERQLSRMNRDACHKGFRVDVNLAHQYLDTIATDLGPIEREIPWDWDRSAETPIKPKFIREQCRIEGISCPSSLAEDSVECMMWEAEHSAKFKWIKGLREWKKRHFCRTRIQQLLAGVDEDGIYRYDLKYCGADSGRYSAGYAEKGSKGRFSVHNMPKFPIHGIDIRKLLIAREGHAFMIWDLAQIEPRLVHWMTGNKALLEKIRSTGVSVYQAEAETCYGKKWTDLKKEDPKLYGFIKAQYLGCQYQCSGTKFRLLARNSVDMELSQEEANTIVRNFRTNNPLVPKLWWRLQDNVKRASIKNEDITLILPSGRRLTYFGVRPGPFGYEAQFTKGAAQRWKIYGGLLTNNLIQGAGRDVFCDDMRALEATEFGAPLWHAHDEGINEVPEDIAYDPAKVKKLKDIIVTPPSWAPDLPLGTEIIVSKHYLK